MTFFVDDRGRWSGGGQAVLANLAYAARLSDGLLSTNTEPGATPLIPRNVPVDFPRALKRYIWMPQNALPYSPGVRGNTRLRYLLRIASEVSRHRAGAMVRISETLPSLGRRPTSRVLHNVLDEGFDALVTPGPAPLTGDFVALGSAHSYRNLSGLVRAHQRYRREGGLRRLVVQTSPGDTHEEKVLRIQAGQNDELVLRTGGATRGDCLELMRGAHAVLFPSSVEASPMTLLEARACGALTGISTIPPHTSLAGPSTVTFDGRSETSIAHALHTLDATERAGDDPLVEGAEREAARQMWAEQLIGFLEAVR